MKEKILLLKRQGKSYKEICEELKISKTTIWRNTNPNVNKSHRDKWKETINERKRKAKNLLGGSCSICGYNKSFSALDLHHKDRLSKSDRLKEVKDWRKLSKLDFDKEIEKCILVCKNCHCEIHDKEKAQVF